MGKKRGMGKKNMMEGKGIKGDFLTEKKMEEGNTYFLMVQDMMEILKIINLMGLDK